MAVFDATTTSGFPGLPRLYIGEVEDADPHGSVDRHAETAKAQGATLLLDLRCNDDLRRLDPFNIDAPANEYAAQWLAHALDRVRRSGVEVGTYSTAIDRIDDFARVGNRDSRKKWCDEVDADQGAVGSAATLYLRLAVPYAWRARCDHFGPHAMRVISQIKRAANRKGYSLVPVVEVVTFKKEADEQITPGEFQAWLNRIHKTFGSVGLRDSKRGITDEARAEALDFIKGVNTGGGA